MKSERIERLGGSIRQIETNPPLFQIYFSKKGKRYFFQKDLNGNPLRTEAQAYDLLSTFKDQGHMPLFSPEFHAKDHSVDFDKAITKWAESSVCSIEWKEKRKRIVENILIPYFRNKGIRSFQDEDIRKFITDLQAKGLKDKTIKNYLGELKQFFKSKRKEIPSEKMPEFPKIKVQKPAIKSLTRQEQNQVFEFIEDHNLPIFIFMRYSACRPNEAGGIQKRSIDFQNGEFVIENALGKGRRLKDTTKTKIAKPLPLIPKILEAIKPLMDSPGEFLFTTKAGNPYTTVRLERIWKAASVRANKQYGTKIVNLYNGLKHSFGVQRLDEGYDLDEVREVMRHTDSQTTRRYAEYSNRRLGGVMRGASQEFHSEDENLNSGNQKGKWSGREDLNLRHLTPHASALPGCATPRSK
jgi:integrase